MRNAPMYVCLGDHDNFFPGPGAISEAFDLPEGGRFEVRYGPIQVVAARRRAQRAGRHRVRSARRCAQTGPAVRFVVCHRPLQVGDAHPARAARRRSVNAVFSGHLHRYERRTV